MKIEDAISRFERACLNPKNDKTRKGSVKCQYNRDFWEIADEKGLIRIGYIGEGLFTIDLWHSVLFYDAATMNPYEKEYITSNTYDYLKECFFGDFKEDKAYLKRIGAI